MIAAPRAPVAPGGQSAVFRQHAIATTPSLPLTMEEPPIRTMPSTERRRSVSNASLRNILPPDAASGSSITMPRSSELIPSMDSPTAAASPASDFAEATDGPLVPAPMPTPKSTS